MSHAQALPACVAGPDRAHQALGQIAVDLPGATAIFRRLKLDFCCGGQTPLAQACENKPLSLPEVLDELTRLDRSASKAVPQLTEEMINHILTRFHAVHREQLPELIRMARRVEAVHRNNPQVPQGLSAHLDAMENELLDHIHMENSLLFPASRNKPAAGPPAAAPERTHLAHEQARSRGLVRLNQPNAWDGHPHDPLAPPQAEPTPAAAALAPQ